MQANKHISDGEVDCIMYYEVLMYPDGSIDWPPLRSWEVCRPTEGTGGGGGGGGAGSGGPGGVASQGIAEMTTVADTLVVDCAQPVGDIAVAFCNTSAASGQHLSQIRAAATAISQVGSEQCVQLGAFIDFFATNTDRLRVFSGSAHDSNGNLILARTFQLPNGDPGVLLHSDFFNGGYLWTGSLGGDPNFSYTITLQAALAHEFDHLLNPGATSHYDQHGEPVAGYSPFTSSRSCYGS